MLAVPTEMSDYMGPRPHREEMATAGVAHAATERARRVAGQVESLGGKMDALECAT